MVHCRRSGLLAVVNKYLYTVKSQKNVLEDGKK